MTKSQTFSLFMAIFFTSEWVKTEQLCSCRGGHPVPALGADLGGRAEAAAASLFRRSAGSDLSSARSRSRPPPLPPEPRRRTGLSVRSTVCIVSELPASFKNILAARKCRAGRSERRPGAGPKMTSRGSWPPSRKYENGE